MTKSEYDALESRLATNRASGIARNRVRPCAEFQKLETVNPGPEHRSPANLDAGQNQKTDGPPGVRYSVRVVFLVSDRRRRDAFGMLETVADVLIRALRRLNPPDTGGKLGRAVCDSGK